MKLAHAHVFNPVLGSLVWSMAVISGASSGCGESEETSPTPAGEVSPTALPDSDATPTATPDASGSTASMTCPANASSNTIGVVGCTSAMTEGYVFFAPLSGTTSYLIDKEGRLVHSWPSSYKPGQSVSLLDDGSILRTEMINNSSFKAGAAAGKLQIIDWDGNVTWDWTWSSSTYLTHHDAKMMPNGNVLVLAWEVKSKSEAVAMGRNPSLLSESALWGEHIMEVKPTGATTGEIVWEWRMLEHVVQDYDATKANYGAIAAHPEKIDLNYIGDGGQEATGADWVHLNTVDYNEALDQIVINSRYMGELYILDHSTTTEEAASSEGGTYGMGGDFLYRFGNPSVYDSSDTRYFYGQHSAHWLESGNILVYNNGINRPGSSKYSTVDEFIPALEEDGLYGKLDSGAYGPEGLSWQYSAATPTDMYSDRVGGADRLPNGNTLVVDGPTGKLYEVTEAGTVVWAYRVPLSQGVAQTQGQVMTSQDNAVFRAHHFLATDAALQGRDLTPGDTIELGD